mmetsp:Transcript_47316/g.153601  ORF Transcript_47316/g.153601 Transcript_47316/m.153601 type:complete len:271 (+) Transcript_47316:170-982(+)
MSELSAYEQERARNIRANHRTLEALGLGAPGPNAPQLAKRRRTTSAAERRLPQRQSARLTAASNDAAAPPPTERLSDIPPWEADVFRACEAAAPAGRHVFDQSRRHQHLSVSASGRAVATTGVAGYGAALVHKSARAGAPPDVRWAVRPIRLGVGGFAVGVVPRSMRPPFKSLGKNAASLGAYLASGAFADARGERPFGPAYGEGDLVEVLLRPAVGGGRASRTDIVYLLNGEEVGVAVAGVSAAPGSLACAVQPYMGGVALLESGGRVE